MANVDIFNMIDEWNAGSTVFTAIKMDVTDTASMGSSMLMDLLVGGVSKFNINKAGTVNFVGNNVSTNPAPIFIDGPGGGIYVGAYYNTLVISKSGDMSSDKNARLGPVDMTLPSDGYFGFAVSPNIAIGSGSDVQLHRDDVGVFGMHSGTTPHALNVYNIRSDPSNYERLSLSFVNGVATLSYAWAGTGQERELCLNGNGNANNHQIRINQHGQISGWYQGGKRAAISLDGGVNLSPSDGNVMIFGAAAMARLWFTNTTSNVITYEFGPSRKNFTGDYLGDGNNLLIYGGRANDSSSGGKGGDLTLRGGEAQTPGDHAGGDLVLECGAAAGSGSGGNIRMVGLPTAAAGLPSGAIWNSGGVINIVP